MRFDSLFLFIPGPTQEETASLLRRGAVFQPPTSSGSGGLEWGKEEGLTFFWVAFWRALLFAVAAIFRTLPLVGVHPY